MGGRVFGPGLVTSALNASRHVPRSRICLERRTWRSGSPEQHARGAQLQCHATSRRIAKRGRTPAPLHRHPRPPRASRIRAGPAPSGARTCAQSHFPLPYPCGFATHIASAGASSCPQSPRDACAAPAANDGPRGRARAAASSGSARRPSSCCSRATSSWASTSSGWRTSWAGGSSRACAPSLRVLLPPGLRGHRRLLHARATSGTRAPPPPTRARPLCPRTRFGERHCLAITSTARSTAARRCSWSGGPTRCSRSDQPTGLRARACAAAGLC